MMLKQFKIGCFFLLISGMLSAQKYHKKFNEEFKTNQGVEVNISASNTSIDVVNWDKNKVAVEAIIEIEGLDEKEAQKYLENWHFEALGNKNKVQIKTNSSLHKLENEGMTLYDFSQNKEPLNIVFFENDSLEAISKMITDTIYLSANGMGNVNFSSHFIEPILPKELEIFEFPSVQLNDSISGLENIEFDFDKYEKSGGKYFFEWKNGVDSITFKSKKEWDEFKKTDKFKNFNKELEKNKKLWKEELKKIDKEKLRSEIQKAKTELKKINFYKLKNEMANLTKEAKKINKEMIVAREEMEKIKKKMAKEHGVNYISMKANDFVVNGKKVKVIKKILIKVPKSAVLDLNTRHCEVRLPKTTVSGKVSYGTFNASELNAGKLTISYAPVSIHSLNACSLFLNNVKDAQVAMARNSMIHATTSNIKLAEIQENVEINDKFGQLSIAKISPKYKTFKLFSNSSNLTIDISTIKQKLQYGIGGESFNHFSKPQVLSNFKEKIKGDFSIFSEDKNITINGKYSQLTLIKNQ